MLSVAGLHLWRGERHGLWLTQRFELGQQRLVEPGQVDENDRENRRDGGKHEHQRQSDGPQAIHEMEARVGIEPA